MAAKRGKSGKSGKSGKGGNEHMYMMIGIVLIVVVAFLMYNYSEDYATAGKNRDKDAKANILKTFRSNRPPNYIRNRLGGFATTMDNIATCDYMGEGKMDTSCPNPWGGAWKVKCEGLHAPAQPGYCIRYQDFTGKPNGEIRTLNSRQAYAMPEEKPKNNQQNVFVFPFSSIIKSEI